MEHARSAAYAASVGEVALVDTELLSLIEGSMFRFPADRYQLQDLRCSKTKEVKQNQMGLYSVLASKLECEVPAEQVTMQLNTMRTIADYHDFPWLRESVDFLLQAAPVEHMEQEQVE